MLKVLGIGFIVCALLGFLILFPFAVIGTAIAIFCFWRGWYIAALIIFLVGGFAQLMHSVLYGDENGYGAIDDSEDYDSSDSGFGLPEMFIAYKIGESRGEKKNK